MKNTLLKSIWSIFAAFLFVFVFSIATDLILLKTGLMIDHPFQNNTTGMIIFITLYRCFYQVIGSYITAMLAPCHPMRHVWIGGFIGLALSIIGSIVMKEEGPAWYAYALIILALPTTWIGGNLYLRKKIIS